MRDMVAVVECGHVERRRDVVTSQRVIGLRRGGVNEDVLRVIAEHQSDLRLGFGLWALGFGFWVLGFGLRLGLGLGLA